MRLALLLVCALGQSSALQPAAAAIRPRRSHVVLRGGGGVGGLWSKYLQALEEKPMSTKMATSAVLAGTGDVIAQYIEGTGTFVLRRFLTLVSINVLYIVPILTVTYAFNEGIVNKFKMEPGWQKTGVQLAFDQLVNAPIVIAGFFACFQIATAISTMSGFSGVAGSIGTQLKTSWASTVVSNWKVWVAPQLINFALVPPYARVAFANVVALVWNVVLSIIANK